MRYIEQKTCLEKVPQKKEKVASYKFHQGQVTMDLGQETINFVAPKDIGNQNVEWKN